MAVHASIRSRIAWPLGCILLIEFCRQHVTVSLFLELISAVYTVMNTVAVTLMPSPIPNATDCAHIQQEHIQWVLNCISWL